MTGESLPLSSALARVASQQPPRTRRASALPRLDPRDRSSPPRPAPPHTTPRTNERNQSPPRARLYLLVPPKRDSRGCLGSSRLVRSVEPRESFPTQHFHLLEISTRKPLVLVTILRFHRLRAVTGEVFLNQRRVPVKPGAKPFVCLREEQARRAEPCWRCWSAHL